MHRTFIALVLSAALAVTGLSANTAQAGDRTTEWIAGAAALAIIGLAIHEESKKKKRKRAAQQYYYNNTHTHQPKPYVPHHKVLPRQCRVKEYIHGNKFRGLSRKCLKRNHVNVQALPRSCAVKIHDQHTGQRRIVYGGRCLRQQGYTLAQAY